MPDIFVERTIPVQITSKGLITSFLIPYVLSVALSSFFLWRFKKEVNHLELVRTIG